MGSSDKEWNENRKYEKWQKAQERAKQQLVEAIAFLETRVSEDDTEGYFLEGLTVKVGAANGDGVLIVLKVSRDGEKAVGFSGDSTLIAALTSAAGRWMNGSMKWRPDEYVGGSKPETPAKSG